MDCRVDRARGERLLELLDEEPLAADIGERRRSHLVAAGADLDDLNLDTGNFFCKPLTHDCRLRQCELAGAGAYSDFARHSGQSAVTR